MATKNTALRNKMAEDWAALFAGGTLVIKAGSTTLVTFTLSSPAFGSGSTGTVSAADLPKTETAGAAGTADSAELHSTSSTYTITGLTVGVGTGQVQLDNLSIALGQDVTLTDLDWTESATVS